MAKVTKSDSSPDCKTQPPQENLKDFEASSIRKGAELHGLAPPDAKRLAAVVANLLRGGEGLLSIREVTKDPESLLEVLRQGGPWSITAAEWRGAPKAMILAREDALLLAEILGRMLLPPPYVSGRDLYSRFSRAGPPSALSLGAPKEEPYSPPMLEEALRRDKR